MNDEEREKEQKRHNQTLEKLDEIKSAVTPPAPPPKEITRFEWDQLDGAARAAFVKSGGTVRDLSRDEIANEAAAVQQAAIKDGAILRSDFDAMSDAEKSAYIEKGGSITD